MKDLKRISETFPNDWRIIERKNFSKEQAAWKEHLIKKDVSLEEAKNYIDNNNHRVLFAYRKHPLGGTADIVWGEKYTESENTVKKYVKIIR